MDWSDRRKAGRAWADRRRGLCPWCKQPARGSASRCTCQGESCSGYKLVNTEEDGDAQQQQRRRGKGTPQGGDPYERENTLWDDLLESRKLLLALCTFSVVLVAVLLLWILVAQACSASPEEDEERWSVEGRHWCCSMPSLFKIGEWVDCTALDERLDCSDERGMVDRSAADKAYCCESEGKGCSATAQVAPTARDMPLVEIDRRHGADGSHHRPPSSQASGAGPFTSGAQASDAEPFPSGPARYDCSVGWKSWQDGWSVSKQTWCCQHVGRGCKMPTQDPTMDSPYCDTAMDPRHGWSPVKEQWCCWYRGVACPPSGVSTTQLPYECLPLDPAKAVLLWPPEKLTWCCNNLQLGCGTPLRMPPAPCIDCEMQLPLGPPASLSLLSSLFGEGGEK